MRERKTSGEKKTGLGEAAQPTEAASSPTAVASRGDGSRADGGIIKEKGAGSKGEEAAAVEESIL